MAGESGVIPSAAGRCWGGVPCRRCTSGALLDPGRMPLVLLSRSRARGPACPLNGRGEHHHRTSCPTPLLAPPTCILPAGGGAGGRQRHPGSRTPAAAGGPAGGHGSHRCCGCGGGRGCVPGGGGAARGCAPGCCSDGGAGTGRGDGGKGGRGEGGGGSSADGKGATREAGGMHGWPGAMGGMRPGTTFLSTRAAMLLSRGVSLDGGGCTACTLQGTMRRACWCASGRVPHVTLCTHGMHTWYRPVIK